MGSHPFSTYIFRQGPSTRIRNKTIKRNSMKKKHVKSLLPAFLLLGLLPAAVKAQDTLQSNPGPANYGTIPLAQTVEPTTTPFGTVGMSNVTSAEPLGAGRLGAQERANFYEQSEAGPGTPAKDAQITDVTAGAALGLNPYNDGFIGADIYSLRSTGVSASGLGTSFLGAQGTLPLPEDLPIRLGLQLVSLFGTSTNAINTTLTTKGDQGAYGYDYLETRRYTDLMARLTQSLIFSGESMGLKIHFNEGVISSFQPDKGDLLVTGVGVQFIVTPPLVLGVELNDRTFLSNPLLSDPMWVTPSVVFRTPAHMNVQAGSDISISKNRADGTRTLEPWRGFLAVSFSYDTQAEMKRQQAQEALRVRMEKEALARQARQAEITRDSLAQATAANDARQKQIADSLAVKAQQDSILLVATQGALKEEISKRSDAEKQLLGTGMLLLDAVYFKTGKTDISINSKPYLNIIAKMLAKYPKLQIEVSGHTDNVGNASYNLSLSQGRAEAVRAYMAAFAPALNDHLSARGYGMTQPKADNGTEDGRKHNRRIEIRVLNKDVLQEYNR